MAGPKDNVGVSIGFAASMPTNGRRFGLSVDTFDVSFNSRWLICGDLPAALCKEVIASTSASYSL